MCKEKIILIDLKDILENLDIKVLLENLQDPKLALELCE